MVQFLNSLCILFFLVSISCCSVGQYTPTDKEVIAVSLITNKNDFGINFGNAQMDDSPEDFLSAPSSMLNVVSVNDEKSSALISSLLDSSIVATADNKLPTYDTDVVAVIEYKNLLKDTIGISYDTDRPVIIGNTLCYNTALANYLIHLLCLKDERIRNYRKNSLHNGKYNYFSKPQFSELALFPPDYGYFQGTELESLAKAIQLEDTSEINTILLRYPNIINKCYSNEDSTLVYNVQTAGARIVTSCIKYQQYDILLFLLKKGLDLELQDGCDFGYTALMTACENSHYMKMAKALIDAGALIDNPIENSTCATPLQVCAVCRNILMAEHLIKLGANIDTRNRIGQNAFDLAMIKRNYKMAYLFTLYQHKQDLVTVKKGTKVTIVEYINEHPAKCKEDQKYAELLCQRQRILQR